MVDPYTCCVFHVLRKIAHVPVWVPSLYTRKKLVQTFAQKSPQRPMVGAIWGKWWCKHVFTSLFMHLVHLSSVLSAEGIFSWICHFYMWKCVKGLAQGLSHTFRTIFPYKNGMVRKYTFRGQNRWQMQWIRLLWCKNMLTSPFPANGPQQVHGSPWNMVKWQNISPGEG